MLGLFGNAIPRVIGCAKDYLEKKHGGDKSLASENLCVLSPLRVLLTGLNYSATKSFCQTDFDSFLSNDNRFAFKALDTTIEMSRQT